MWLLRQGAGEWLTGRVVRAEQRQTSMLLRYGFRQSCVFLQEHNGWHQGLCILRGQSTSMSELVAVRANRQLASWIKQLWLWKWFVRYCISFFATLYDELAMHLWSVPLILYYSFLPLQLIHVCVHVLVLTCGVKWLQCGITGRIELAHLSCQHSCPLCINIQVLSLSVMMNVSQARYLKPKHEFQIPDMIIQIPLSI